MSNEVRPEGHGEGSGHEADQMDDRPEPVYRTKSGRILSDADIEALADEAERGYDVSRMKALPPDDGATVAAEQVPGGGVQDSSP